MLVLIDNYDSFTYNVAQAFGQLGAQIEVYRNDALTVDQLEAMQPSHIIISPGPGDPDDGGISLEVLQRLSPRIPTFGVCLGHQCIGQAFGGNVIRATRQMHGKVSQIYHQGSPLFTNVPAPFEATRYHSLIVEDHSLPSCLEVTALTSEGEIMALRHKEYPIVGVQFHPESILTTYGSRIMQNFLECRL
jgi:anthranilate synthase/aminodeoxychorismate synthase-like glutamine amidotransferase